MTNWAANLATGGAAQPIGPSQAFMTVQGPATTFAGGKTWASQFDPQTGLITFTNPGNPRQSFQSDIAGVAKQGGDIPQTVLDQWNASHQSYLNYQSGGGAGGGGGRPGTQEAQFQTPTASYLPTGADVPSFQTWFSQNVGKTILVNGQMRTIGAGGTAGGELDPSEALQAFQGGQLGWQQPAGQQLGLAWQDIQAQQSALSQLGPLQAETQRFTKTADEQAAQLYQQGQDIYGQAQPVYAQAQDLYAQAGPMYQQAAQLYGQAQPMYQEAQLLESQAQDLYGKGFAELTGAEQQIARANALEAMTTTGMGLFPAQAAFIEAGRQAQRTQLGSTFGTAGLGQSSQLAQLQGAADLQAAATAGQLQQGNIQAATQVLQGALGQQAGAQQTLAAAGQRTGLSQQEIAAAQAQVAAAQNQYGVAQKQVGLSQQELASYTNLLAAGQAQIALGQTAQKLSLAGQELSLGEQGALVTELQNIATQSQGLQKTLWDEAMSGYGILGNMIQIAGQTTGVSVQAYTSMLQAEQQQNSLAAQAQAQQASASQQGSNGLMGGLGQIFGGMSGLLGGAGAGIGGAGAGAFGTVAGVGTAAASAGAAGS
jgi:hypothetical protein